MSIDREKDFEMLFKEHFAPLCSFACKYIPDFDDAKGVVHDVFVSVWNKFGELPPGINHKSYLYTSVRNRCFNFIRNNKRKVGLDAADEADYALEDAGLEAKELEEAIAAAIASLPDKCREVFELSRYEGKKYGEIADLMGISVKTVEGQMSKALRVLREKLAPFLSIIILLGTIGETVFHVLIN